MCRALRRSGFFLLYFFPSAYRAGLTFDAPTALQEQIRRAGGALRLRSG
jgi:hypothetical protein